MLAVPRLLDELVTAGRWPRDSKESLAQNLKPLAPPERIRALAPEEDWLYLLPPPFYTVRHQSEGNPFWLSDMAAPHGIDFDLATRQTLVDWLRRLGGDHHLPFWLRARYAAANTWDPSALPSTRRNRRAKVHPKKVAGGRSGLPADGSFLPSRLAGIRVPSRPTPSLAGHGFVMSPDWPAWRFVFAFAVGGE
jgi:hypothetical protein